MERRAILIGTNRATSDHLQGVDADIRNLYEYLRSDVGGAWEHNEIVHLPAPSADGLGQLLVRCQRDQPDFLFVAFSGHGFENRYDEPIICLSQDQNLAVAALQGHAIRQVTVIDACRVQVPGNLRERHIVAGTDVGGFERSDYRKSCRDFFDTALRSVPSGDVLLQSCLSGQYSSDYPNGGLFLHSLVNQARFEASRQSNWQQCRRFQPIRDAFDAAFSVTNQHNRNQHPVSRGTEREGGQLPFAVA